MNVDYRRRRQEEKINGEAARFVEAAAEIQKDDPQTYTVEQRNLYVKSLVQQISALVRVNST
jgi:hypothetical protein